MGWRWIVDARSEKPIVDKRSLAITSAVAFVLILASPSYRQQLRSRCFWSEA